MEKELDTIHSCIHNKLKSESRLGVIERNKLVMMLGYYYHIPKEQRNNLIDDLEKKGLIEVVNRFEIKII